MRIRALSIMLTLLALTACVQLPRPVSPQEAPRPAMTMAEAVAFQHNLIATLKRADAKSDFALISTVLGGPELQQRQGEYYRHRNYGSPIEPIDPGQDVVQVYAAATRSYPRRALIMTTRKPNRTSADDRAIYAVVRESAGSPWRRTMGVIAKAASISSLSLPANGLVPAVPKKLNGFDTSTNDALAKAVRNPRRHRATWKQTKVLTDRAATYARIQKNKDLRSTTWVITPLRGYLATAPTSDGGALVLGVVSENFARTYVDGSYLYYTKSYGLNKRYPDHYKGALETSTLTFLFKVPARGPIVTTDMTESFLDTIPGQLDHD